ncbi:MAG: hypothetical protein ACRCYS_05540 [Beijerinckiaceae bacterium]
MWPFRKKPEPPRDLREWNEDWKIGDTAECIIEPTSPRWSNRCPPWERPALGQRLTVSGFAEGEMCGGTAICYFLRFSDWPSGLTTTAFRKVRPVATEQSEVAKRILKAPKVGPDRVREDA